MKKFLILLVLPLLLAGGCGDDNRPFAGHPSLEDWVIANCYDVRDSVEAYAAKNGDYPSSFTRDWLYNPSTFDLTEPTRSYAINPGETGYVSYWVGGKYVGYVITGFGKTAEIFRLYRNYPDSLMALDSLVVANCYIVQTAAEAFAAENNGVYADDVAVCETLAGNTLTDFLPGGASLENPFTTILTEPIDGSPYLPGQTSYVDIKDASATQVGYTITGYGAQWIIFTIRKFPGQPF